MPKMNGIEFLGVAKNDNNIKSIPVIILTTSKADQDRIDTFKFSVAGYMIKPVNYMQFVDTVRTIHLYWNLSDCRKIKIKYCYPKAFLPLLIIFP